LVRAILSGCLLAGSLLAQVNYENEILTWRQKQEADIRGEEGWLTVAGLFWLKEGTNRAGSDPSMEVVLPKGSAPASIGAFEFRQEKITFRAAPGASVTSKGQPVNLLEMKPDTAGAPDILAIGDLSLFVIHRGQRYGIRVKHKSSAARREFTGLKWYPVRASWRISAEFVPHPSPKQIAVPNVLGDVERMPSPGSVLFTLEGKQYRLEPVLAGKDQLFFIFSDKTNRRTTYATGRFLYTPLPRNGRVDLDFNKATNPPCAFTPFATCPLPPPQNRLEVAIEAGELAYHSSAG
jgi:hypothetical protein